MKPQSIEEFTTIPNVNQIENGEIVKTVKLIQ